MAEFEVAASRSSDGRGDDHAVEGRSGRSPGHQIDPPAVEFVAKRAPRQGTSSRDGEQDFKMGCSITAEGSNFGDGASSTTSGLGDPLAFGSSSILVVRNPSICE